jgi:hypothetical protein
MIYKKEITFFGLLKIGFLVLAFIIGAIIIFY